MKENTILEVSNLTIDIKGNHVVDNISFNIKSRMILALVGESGSGKTMTALSILDLLPDGAGVVSGSIKLNGTNIFDLTNEEKRKIRGSRISMVFQEPFMALNPVIRCGIQISEVVMTHEGTGKRKAEERAAELLSKVGLREDSIRRYPHELSGGERQRVMLAIALSCNPEVLLLDEPTTALDVSIQKDILDLIMDIQKEHGYGILFITHDFSIVNLIADEVCVLKKGCLLESGTKEEILLNPKDRYTKHLIECIPRLGDVRKRLPVLDALDNGFE